MKYYLVKTDPEDYSLEDLKNDKVTAWSGVHNPQALKYLKAMEPGDLVLIYHSGEGTIRGLAKVLGNSRPNPKDSESRLVDIQFIRGFAEPFVNLAKIKQSKLFADLALVRQGQLSVMPVPDKFVRWLKRQGLKVRP